MTNQPFSPISDAIMDLHSGRIVVVSGAEGSVDHGYLVLPAQHVTPEAINFMATAGRGLICLALEPRRCDELGLELMAATKSEAASQPAFTVSVEARQGVTTGISAYDRARTIQVAADPTCTRDDLVHPGHVFPLRAREGGVLAYPGAAEAAVDLARLAGLTAAGVTCAVMDDNGAVARLPNLERFCVRHGLRLVTVEQLISHRRRYERLVQREVEVKLPTTFGDFCAVGYHSLIGVGDHVALVKGQFDSQQCALVHVHQQCLTGDALYSVSCDCRNRLETALATIEAAGAGVLVYLARSDPTARADQGPDYAIAAQILVDLGLSMIRTTGGDREEAVELQKHGLQLAASSLNRLAVPYLEALPAEALTRAHGALSAAPRTRSV